MISRHWLRNALIRSWHSTISEAYVKGLVNSERGLQVHFCSRLLEAFEEEGAPGPRRLFIEPQVKVINSASVLVPDVLICNSKRIIGVVELKYKPRTRAAFDKDLSTLAAFGAKASGLEIENKRYLGPDLKRPTFSVAEDAVLCWAAIYRSKAELPLTSWSKSDPRFLGLHALTRDGEAPLVITPSKRLSGARAA